MPSPPREVAIGRKHAAGKNKGFNQQCTSKPHTAAMKLYNDQVERENNNTDY